MLVYKSRIAGIEGILESEFSASLRKGSYFPISQVFKSKLHNRRVLYLSRSTGLGKEMVNLLNQFLKQQVHNRSEDFRQDSNLRNRKLIY
jgi:hypothetical protein